MREYEPIHYIFGNNQQNGNNGRIAGHETYIKESFQSGTLYHKGIIPIRYSIS